MGDRSRRILVTNDDGIASAGLHVLARRLGALGEVIVVAPEAEQSAVGHSITTRVPLRIKQVALDGVALGYSVDGTPADCVKLALGTVLRDRWPDLVVSGINLGPNTATNVIYSGTVSAATEARILGVPSFAISLGTFRDPRWTVAADVGAEVARQVLDHGLPPRVLLNVNVPNLPAQEIRGARFTRQGESAYLEEFVQREDPRGRPYYWLAGSYLMRDTDEETDAWALEHGYLSITPITFDLTADGLRDEIAAWGWGD
ncbi:MAG: 5'/3'-nucleotidase SurE [Candidatus Dormiibacterota bacterium]|jgi:5'-nucleotidase